MWRVLHIMADVFWLILGGTACLNHRCYRSTTGLSRYCRRHTAEIIGGRNG